MAKKTSPTRWVGWVYFAGAMMLVGGGMQLIAGLVGIFNSSFYAVSNGQLVAFNATTWGWLNLFMGIFVMLAGIGVWAGVMWARVVAIAMAALALVSNMAFVSSYPVWGVTLMVVNGLVLYALTLHGDEVGDE